MERSSSSLPRRTGVTAVHSLHRFVFTVPDLDDAQRFYTAFGLDARREGERLDLYSFGNPHRWGSIYRAPGRKKLQYLSFAAYPEDLEPLRRHLDKIGAPQTKAHPLADEEGLWLKDPDGTARRADPCDRDGFRTCSSSPPTCCARLGSIATPSGCASRISRATSSPFCMARTPAIITCWPSPSPKAPDCTTRAGS